MGGIGTYAIVYLSHTVSYSIVRSQVVDALPASRHHLFGAYGFVVGLCRLFTVTDYGPVNCLVAL